MTRDMHDLLDRLSATWRRAGFDVDNEMSLGQRPPVSVVATPGLAWPLPDDLITWFSWHDGAAGNPRATIAPSRFEPLSLDEALTRREERLALATDLAHASRAAGLQFDSEHFWKPSWLPIGNDNVGGCLTIETVGSGSRTGPVRAVEWADPDFRTVGMSSLDELVERWIDLLQRTTWAWDQSARAWRYDYLSIDNDLRGSGLAG